MLLAYTGDFAFRRCGSRALRWLCRVWPFFAVAMLLWNANAVLSAALPFATAAAVLLVGFNRTTRQDPEISTRPGYLLLSGGVLAAVCAGPFLLSAVLWLPVQRRLRLPFTLAGSCRCCSCF